MKKSTGLSKTKKPKKAAKAKSTKSTKKVLTKPPAKSSKTSKSNLIKKTTDKKTNTKKVINKKHISISPKKTSKNKKDTKRTIKKTQLHSFTSIDAVNSFWQDVLSIINQSIINEDNQRVIQKALTDKMLEIQQSGFSIPDDRLNSKEWESNPFYAQVRTWYAYNSMLWSQFAKSIPLPDFESRRKVVFLTRQLIDFFSPANFSLLNPEFINKTIETKGENIKNGMVNLAHDLQKGRITHVNENNFELGENLATTEGKVIYRTSLFELIEYQPLTAKVSKNPMLFVPPCINKYYIMDLSPKNSLVRYTVMQGQHLYLISWRNIDAETQDTSWEDYINAVITAIGIVREDNQNQELNILGFCVGGTILATTLAVMAAKKMKLPNSMTLLTTMLDFKEPGDLGVFLNERLIIEMEDRLKVGGAVVPGSSLAQVFSILRPRDLVWNYVSSKYFKGETPRDFDILYWNSDSTNQSLKMMAWYLRNCYWENNLSQKKAKVLDEKVNLEQIKIPTYVYCSRDDHIVPWTSAYKSAKSLGGNVRFVLGASGHIAGVINPPANNKRNYWLGKNNSQPTFASIDEWYDQAESYAGSWWPDWTKWLNQFNGGEIADKQTKYQAKKSVARAPGKYVRQRIKTETSPLPLMSILEKFSNFNLNSN